MPKYKIHIVESLPDDQSIQRHQNFPVLFKRYKSITRFQFWRNLYRNPRSFATVVLICSIAYLVFQADMEERSGEENKEVPAQVERNEHEETVVIDSSLNAKKDTLFIPPTRDL